MTSPSRQKPFQLSLRIRHPSIDPAEISRELGVEAEHSFRAGAPRRLRVGLPESVYAETYWIGVLKPTAQALVLPLQDDARSRKAHEHLAAAVETLSWALGVSATRFCNVHGDFLRRLRAEGAELTLLVTISEGGAAGFTLPPQASRIFGEMGLTLELGLADN